jgi:hypothetical protein
MFYNSLYTAPVDGKTWFMGTNILKCLPNTRQDKQTLKLNKRKENGPIFTGTAAPLPIHSTTNYLSYTCQEKDEPIVIISLFLK